MWFVFVRLQKSDTELLKKVSEVVMKGLEALARAASTLFPADSSAVTDSAFMQVGQLIIHAEKVQF